MADMTSKHHRLIADGIVHGVQSYVNKLSNDNNAIESGFIRSLTGKICLEMVDRLYYTNDKFDLKTAKTWRADIGNRIDTIIHKARTKNNG